jgi:hypothetical protein
MVRAILNGSKTQTRRAVKPRKDLNFGVQLAAHELAGEVNDGDFTNSPFGQPGDRLWVRETTYDVERHGWIGPVFVESDEGRSAAEWGYGESDDPDFIEPHELRKRPAIHMPRAMCRLVLEITCVRVEQLNDISDEDCIAEGIGLNPSAAGVMFSARDDDTLPRAMYRDLWENLYGVEAWVANPWIWVIEFKRVDRAQGT